MIKTIDRIRWLLIAAGWLLALFGAVAAEMTLLPFSLEGSDGDTYNERSWNDRALVLFLATRASAEYNEKRVWSAPIAALFNAPVHADAVALVRVANVSEMRNVPRLFRGMVRSALKPSDGEPVPLSLIDWEGTLARSYEVPDDAYNVLVFDRRGHLVFSAALREFDQARLDAVLLELQDIADELVTP
jgi:hypothetical protein